MRLPRLRRFEAAVFRAPIEIPVRTSFGTMRDRPAVFVRLEAEDGCIGWGEAWCNFPAAAAEYRARLVADLLGPLVVSRLFASPLALFTELVEQTRVIALQSGDFGPIAQAIAAIDIAAWDIAARQAGQPLWRALGGSSPVVRSYASGINPAAPEERVKFEYAKGHRAFKLKVGFGHELDLRNIRAVREAIGPQGHFAVDANQAWTLETAVELTPALEPFGLAWLEEPLRADMPWADWRVLQAACATPLAGGENIAGARAFEDAIAEKVFRVIQPDIAKWGGISGCFAVAKKIVASGLIYCPHFLGGGIGLAASAHLLAAIGGDGLLELDVNENPLRERLLDQALLLHEGCIRLPEKAGIGLDLGWERIAPFKAASFRYPD